MADPSGDDVVLREGSPGDVPLIIIHGNPFYSYVLDRIVLIRDSSL